jgi:hypothetical protein
MKAAHNPNPARAGMTSPRGPRTRRSAGPAVACLTAVAVLTVLVGAAGCSSSPSSSGSARAAAAQLVGGAATTSAPPGAAATEAATGAIVHAFPTTLLPLPPGAKVTASAVQRHDAVLDVSLSGTTPAAAAAVLDFYARTLGKAGFSQTKGSVLPPGAVGLAFSRGDGRELLVVAVADRGGLRSFSVGGTVAGQ